MRGERAEAERMSARIAAGAYGHKWGLDVQARAAIAAALGDNDAAVALLAPAWYMDQSSGSVHGTFTFGRLRDYPPFIALIKPRD